VPAVVVAEDTDDFAVAACLKKRDAVCQSDFAPFVLIIRLAEYHSRAGRCDQRVEIVPPPIVTRPGGGKRQYVKRGQPKESFHVDGSRPGYAGPLRTNASRSCIQCQPTATAAVPSEPPLRKRKQTVRKRMVLSPGEFAAISPGLMIVPDAHAAWGTLSRKPITRAIRPSSISSTSLPSMGASEPAGPRLQEKRTYSP
jgi:hypothetical protein